MTRRRAIQIYRYFTVTLQSLIFTSRRKLQSYLPKCLVLSRAPGTSASTVARSGLAVVSEASTTRTELLRRRTATLVVVVGPIDRRSVASRGGHDRRLSENADNELERWCSPSRYRPTSSVISPGVRRYLLLVACVFTMFVTNATVAYGNMLAAISDTR